MEFRRSNILARRYTGMKMPSWRSLTEESLCCMASGIWQCRNDKFQNVAFGQKSDTRKAASSDKILHRDPVCAVSEPTCSTSAGGRAYEKREYGSLRKNCKTRRELFGIRVIKKDNTSKVRQMYPEAWHMFYLLENENNLVRRWKSKARWKY